ncbi:hypothetical protein PybrP1_011091, partial [[Pythium] brassicae (nom. inval.)]
MGDSGVFDAHVAAGGLQAMMGILFGDLQRLVRDCVREHTHQCTGLPIASAVLSKRADSILAEKMAAQGDGAQQQQQQSARDFAAYLKFVQRHWNEFFAGQQYDKGYRYVVGRAIACRNTVAHQGELDRAAFDDAVDTLWRLAVFIGTDRGRRDKLRLLARVSSVESLVAAASTA